MVAGGPNIPTVDYFFLTCPNVCVCICVILTYSSYLNINRDRARVGMACLLFNVNDPVKCSRI